MQKPARISAILAAVLVISTLPLPAEDAPEGLQIRDLQRYHTNSPFSGPVEAIAMTEHTTIRRGAVMDVFVAVQNHSNDTTAGVVIDLDLRYADGVPVQPFHLGAERAQTLGPDEGVGFFIFWLIPADAPPGVGSFTINARVTRLSEGDEGHDDSENPMIATDSVTFEVIP